MNECERCRYFELTRIFSVMGMDCLNEDIDQESYERHLGQNEKNCPYFELRR